MINTQFQITHKIEKKYFTFKYILTKIYKILLTIGLEPIPTKRRVDFKSTVSTNFTKCKLGKKSKLKNTYYTIKTYISINKSI